MGALGVLEDTEGEDLDGRPSVGGAPFNPPPPRNDDEVDEYEYDALYILDCESPL